MREGSKQPTGRAAPWRGRRRVKDPRSHFIAVRCSDTEYAAIIESAKRAGLSIGAYLRAAALGDSGPRSVRRPPLEHQALAWVVGQVGKIGSNVNQIAKSFNGSGLLPGFPEILAMKRDIAEMRGALLKALGRGD